MDYSTLFIFGKITTENVLIKLKMKVLLILFKNY